MIGIVARMKVRLAAFICVALAAGALAMTAADMAQAWQSVAAYYGAHDPLGRLFTLT
jgi:hypothetical protein